MGTHWEGGAPLGRKWVGDPGEKTSGNYAVKPCRVKGRPGRPQGRREQSGLSSEDRQGASAGFEARLESSRMWEPLCPQAQ